MNVLKFLVAMLFAYLFASFAHTTLTKARNNNMTTSIDNHKQALRSISKEMLRDDFNILKLKNQQGHRINCLKKEDLENPSFFNTKEQHLISAKKHRSDMITAFNKRVKTFVKLAKKLKVLIIKNLGQNESCDEVMQRTANDILVYYKIIDYAAHRAIICGSESGNTAMTQEKPDYDMIFCSDIDNPIMRKLYEKFELELGQNAETQEILTILNQMQTILRFYPKFCSEKWDLERTIEKLRQNNQFYINDPPNELLEQGLLYTATHIPDSRVKIGLKAEELSGGFISVITNLMTNFNAALTNANETQEFENKEYETGNGKVTEYNIEEELEDEKEADEEDESALQLLHEPEADMQ